MTLTFTLLGCGFSGGVPRPGMGWGKCNPANPKNRRRRCSLLVERRNAEGKVTRVLIDTSPDLREQLVDAGVDWVDGVLFTHEHADHTHGIDDLRGLFIHKRRRVEVYLDDATAAMMHSRFAYCFTTPPGSNYPPILNENRVTAGQPVTITGEGGPITAMPFEAPHGDITALGYRIEGLAYTPDVVDLPPASVDQLGGLDVWIIDALWYRQHPSHFSVDDALRWIDQLKPRRAILTNLHSDLDFDELGARLPPQVEAGYDGLVVQTA